MFKSRTSAERLQFRKDVRAYKKKHRSKLLLYTFLAFIGILTVMKTYTTWRDGTFTHWGSLAIPARVSDRQLLSAQGEFPEDIFADDLKNGAFLIHVAGVMFAFAGLAIICDVYFEPSLDAIGNWLDLSDDVNGATFMAAGSSAPELFASILGTFVAKSDVGIGTIVGSAVFNMLFILAAIGIVMKENGGVGLQWYPISRDITFYCLSIIFLVLAVADQLVDPGEAGVLFGLYVLYIVWMKYNSDLERLANGWCDAKFVPTPGQAATASAVDHVAFVAFIYACIVLNIVLLIWTAGMDIEPEWSKIANYVISGIFVLEMFVKWYAYGVPGYWKDVFNFFDGLLVGFIILEFSLEGSSVSSLGRGLRLIKIARALRSLRILRLVRSFSRDFTNQGVQTDLTQRGFGPLKFLTARARGSIADYKTIEAHGADGEEMLPLMADEITEAKGEEGTQTETEGAVFRQVSSRKILTVTEEQDKDSSDDSDDEEPQEPWKIPEETGDRFAFAFTCSIHWLYYLTVPNCSQPQWKKWFFLTFIMSIVWIVIWSYIMVWMSTILGEFIGLDPAIMGLTFLAAGTSLPDTLASVGAAQDGKGDMAVSNAIGSNVFDICICLGVVYMIKGLINEDGSGGAVINSENLSLLVFTLFLIVAFCMLALKVEGWLLGSHMIVKRSEGGRKKQKVEVECWQLSPRVGWLFNLLYVGFVLESLYLEGIFD